MKKMNVGTACLLMIFSAQSTNAQQSINASGGDISGANGTVAYSVGQTFYQQNGTSSSITISEGVQQAVDLTVGADEIPGINISMTVFPNPSSTIVHVNIGDFGSQNVSIQLIDATGKLVLAQRILQQETTISVQDLPTGTYYLEAYAQEDRFKTFNLIKH